jgi:FtsH-binding integral membrane protein
MFKGMRKRIRSRVKTESKRRFWSQIYLTSGITILIFGLSWFAQIFDSLQDWISAFCNLIGVSLFGALCLYIGSCLAPEADSRKNQKE